MKNVLYTLFGVIAGFILAGILLLISRAPAGEAIVLQPAPTESPIAIHVVGAVTRPGLYKFPEGARVQDAIDAAGGTLAEANINSINLAALLTDGQQLSIPYKDGSAPPEEAASPALDLPGGEEDPFSYNPDLVDINIASLEELDALPGIGPAIAQRIIDYRDQNGPFIIIEDLANVDGIGDTTIERIRDLITTGY